MWLYKKTQIAVIGVCLETAQWSVSVSDSLVFLCWVYLLPPVLWANSAVDEALSSVTFSLISVCYDCVLFPKLFLPHHEALWIVMYYKCSI